MKIMTILIMIPTTSTMKAMKIITLSSIVVHFTGSNGEFDVIYFSPLK